MFTNFWYCIFAEKEHGKGHLYFLSLRGCVLKCDPNAFAESKRELHTAHNSPRTAPFSNNVWSFGFGAVGRFCGDYLGRVRVTKLEFSLYAT